MEQPPEEMSPNEIVAYRLKQAREEIHPRLTQERAAAMLRRYLGKAWSRGTYSNAERYTGDRVRRFTPEELYAFSRVFGKPLWWFLLPPSGVRVAGKEGSSQLNLSGPEAFEAIFGTPTHGLFEELRDVLREAPEEERTAFQGRIQQVTEGIVIEVAIEDATQKRVEALTDRLHESEEQLRDAVNRAERAARTREAEREPGVESPRRGEGARK